MQKISRHKTRDCLFQALYSKIYLQDSFLKESFLDNFFEGNLGFLDQVYFEEMFSGIIEKEGKLVYVIEKFAPKFDISSMSVINIIPVLIASYEMLYLKCDKVPENVSINEALELVKFYSDPQGRIFINGVLNSLKQNKTEVKKELTKITNKNLFFNNYDQKKS
ncbi:hypothetical protein M0P65_00700 [Candidatus Gracilibacteria bacterium]|nr:hypothetical protein [Candidatus Gracilibacteria bacterium]